ncbi:response regulator [Pseudoalteromonas sp. MMG010]|uniref:response regulator n=1 Tax=Pseudoalteromonas sp. MMG010 TaxID=2822685 RepID=UPI001B3A523E|nr:response regulator [Pseudoalteromonas sp. MMG010]MBQ4834658.1 response regulator [Pseudoalteromonas sp. MMG010]
MAAKNILIVEDEENIAEVLIAYAQQNNFNTEHYRSGLGVVNFVKNNTVDLILLDLMLPDVDGIQICKQLKAISEVPIIILSAKGQENDRLLGLEIGADDYICKPFSPKEVIARIKAVLRRTDTTPKNIINVHGFELYKHDFEAYLHNKSLNLTAIEFKILWLFVSNIGRVFSREEIINNVYNNTLDISDRNIDTHIKNIRKKITHIKTGLNPICSVYSVGYKFKA